MVGESTIRDIIVNQKESSRVAAITVELNEIRVVNGGEDQDFVAEGLGGEGSRMVVVVTLVEVLDGDDSTVVELSQVHGAEPTVADFTLGVEPVGRGFELFVGEDWREETS